MCPFFWRRTGEIYSRSWCNFGCTREFQNHPKQKQFSVWQVYKGIFILNWQTSLNFLINYVNFFIRFFWSTKPNHCWFNQNVHAGEKSHFRIQHLRYSVKCLRWDKKVPQIGRRKYHWKHWIINNVSFLISLSFQFFQPLFAKNQNSTVETVVGNIELLDKSLDQLLTQSNKYDLYQLVAGIYCLKKIQFENNDTEGCSISQASQHAVKVASQLLSLDQMELEDALTNRTFQPAEANLDKIRCVFLLLICYFWNIFLWLFVTLFFYCLGCSIPLNLSQAQRALDGLAKTMYSNLHDWIVQRINQKIDIKFVDPRQTRQYIGILDMPGFGELRKIIIFWNYLWEIVIFCRIFSGQLFWAINDKLHKWMYAAFLSWTRFEKLFFTVSWGCHWYFFDKKYFLLISIH